MPQLRYFTHFFSFSSEAVVQTCFVKKVFLEISQNSLENTCAKVSFLRLWYRYFPVNFVNLQALSYEFTYGSQNYDSQN